jgi:hypothetical protein
MKVGSLVKRKWTTSFYQKIKLKEVTPLYMVSKKYRNKYGALRVDLLSCCGRMNIEEVRPSDLKVMSR